MGSGSGDWWPMYLSLFLVLIIGGFVPLVISGFVPEGSYNHDSVILPFRTFVENGTDIDLPLVPDITVSPFGWLGNTTQSFMVKQVNAFTYIPDAITIPFFIFIVFGFFYTLIKMLPFT